MLNCLTSIHQYAQAGVGSILSNALLRYLSAVEGHVAPFDVYWIQTAMTERIRRWRSELDRAVSPVIGVILMVAITVILAAVIGSFVLGIGGDITETPQVRLSVSDASDSIDGKNNDIFVIEHSGGDTIKKDNINLVINNMSNGGAKLTEIEGIRSDISVGDRIIISEDGNTIKSTAELRIRLVHNPSDNLLFDVTIIVN